MKRKRYRRIDPAKARAAAGGDAGWYERIPAMPREHLPCSSCGIKSATVPGPGGLCLHCRISERLDTSGGAA